MSIFSTMVSKFYDRKESAKKELQGIADKAVVTAGETMLDDLFSAVVGDMAISMRDNDVSSDNPNDPANSSNSTLPSTSITTEKLASTSASVNLDTPDANEPNWIPQFGPASPTTLNLKNPDEMDPCRSKEVESTADILNDQKVSSPKEAMPLPLPIPTADVIETINELAFPLQMPIISSGLKRAQLSEPDECNLICNEPNDEHVNQVATPMDPPESRTSPSPESNRTEIISAPELPPLPMKRMRRACTLKKLPNVPSTSPVKTEPNNTINPIETKEQTKDGMYRITTVTLNCLEDGCSSRFKTIAEMDHHLQDEHQIEINRCYLRNCGQSFIEKAQLQVHLQEAHQKMSKWLCAKCGTWCGSNDTLSFHFAQYHQTGLFICNSHTNCTYQASCRIEVYKHIDSIAINTPKQLTALTCHCGKPFKNRRAIQTHQYRTHTQKSPTHFRGRPVKLPGKLGRAIKVETNFESRQQERCTWIKGCLFASVWRGSLVRHISRAHLKDRKVTKTSRKIVNDFLAKANTITTSQSLKTEIFNSPNELQGDAQPVVENNSLNHLEESSFVEKQQIVHSLNEKPSVDLSGGKVAYATASSTVPSTSQTNSIRVTCSWADCTYQAVGKLQLIEHISSVHI